MDIQTKIDKYSRIIKASYDKEKLDTKSEETSMTLPIKTIDNINVHCVIRFFSIDQPKRCILQVNLDDLYEDETMSYVNILSEMFLLDNAEKFNFKEVAEYIFVKMPTLKLSVHGRLKSKEDIELESLQYELLAGLENVTLDGEECCVCNSITTCKTCCDHSVCYRCMTHIKPVNKYEDDKNEEEYFEKPCPLCRKDITYLKEYY